MQKGAPLANVYLLGPLATSQKMEPYKFTGLLYVLSRRAVSGKKEDIDYILSHLDDHSTFKMTRFVDYALSLVKTKEGIERIEFHLFTGSLIQRNYCSLFLNRNGYWKPVKSAYDQGLIDEIQAYSR